MKAWLIDDLTGIDRLRLAEAPDPVAGPGQVLVEVRYAGLNPADRYLAERQYPANPPLPHILGRDAMGTVASVGDGVAGLRIGDRVAVLRGEAGVNEPGTFAERVAVPADYVVPVPQGWSDEQAAGATLVYLTAWQALTQWGELPPGIVLISGASGGVGVAAVQLAKAMGHTVVGLSRDPNKQEAVRQIGAAAMFDPYDAQWRKALKRFLEDRRVDLAIDNIGGTVLPQMIDVLGMNGKVSIIGRLAGPVPEFNTAALFFRRIRLGGVAVGTYTNAESRAAWQDVLGTLGTTGARPMVDRVFPFEQLPQAFARLAEGPLGKVLVRVGQG